MVNKEWIIRKYVLVDSVVSYEDFLFKKVKKSNCPVLKYVGVIIKKIRS